MNSSYSQDTLEWQGFTWLKRETWGIAHPDNPYKWYDPDCVKVENNLLKLFTKHKPKSINNIIHPTAIGLISCIHPFHFGTYEVIAKLPKGNFLWPAIWLWGLDSWPPEIDIIEGYTKKESYLRFSWPPFAVKSNFHFQLNQSETDSLGAKNVWLGLRPPQNRFIAYGMVWTTDYIQITIDGKVTREISGEVMKHFRNHMRFVINNGIHPKHKVGSPESVFEVKSFSYKGV
jgi:beta-glucanase (GH16 family)